MRIRSIRPEFWSSEDVASMDWDTRLVFIGLWSYVDDNGVGRDLERLIVSALFPLDEDLSEASLRVHRALKHLESGGQITRYVVDGKPYLHIAAWDTHQKVNRPSEGRYPLPTCENTAPHDTLTEPSLSPHGVLSAGEGEKGRRGEGISAEAKASAKPDPMARFDDFWNTYNHKVKRPAAERAWKSAIKKPGVTADLLISKAGEYVARERTNSGGKYIAHPSTWLNGERWADQQTEPDTKDEDYYRNLPRSVGVTYGANGQARG